MLKTEKRLSELASGATLTVFATDPIAKIDIPLYCTQQGHECSMIAEGDTLRFTITKG